MSSQVETEWYRIFFFAQHVRQIKIKQNFDLNFSISTIREIKSIRILFIDIFISNRCRAHVTNSQTKKINIICKHWDCIWNDNSEMNQWNTHCSGLIAPKRMLLTWVVCFGISLNLNISKISFDFLRCLFEANLKRISFVRLRVGNNRNHKNV